MLGDTTTPAAARARNPEAVAAVAVHAVDVDLGSACQLRVEADQPFTVRSVMLASEIGAPARMRIEIGWGAVVPEGAGAATPEREGVNPGGTPTPETGSGATSPAEPAVTEAMVQAYTYAYGMATGAITEGERVACALAAALAARDAAPEGEADGKSYAVRFTRPGTDEHGHPKGADLIRAVLALDVQPDGYSYAAFGPKSRANLAAIAETLDTPADAIGRAAREARCVECDHLVAGHGDVGCRVPGCLCALSGNWLVRRLERAAVRAGEGRA